jgi:hypothetical protein
MEDTTLLELVETRIIGSSVIETRRCISSTRDAGPAQKKYTYTITTRDAETNVTLGHVCRVYTDLISIPFSLLLSLLSSRDAAVTVLHVEKGTTYAVHLDRAVSAVLL